MKKSKWQTTSLASYDILRTLISKDPRSDEVTTVIGSLSKSALEYLSGLERKPLISLVPEKSYFSFDDKKTLSRVVNASVFSDGKLVSEFLDSVRTNDLSKLTSSDITKACYTLTMSFACAVDLLNPRDQKTPATYYEYLIIHLLTRTIQSDRAEQVKVKMSEKEEVSLTLDLSARSWRGET